MVEDPEKRLHSIRTGRESRVIPASRQVVVLQQAGSSAKNLESVPERGDGDPEQCVAFLLLGITCRGAACIEEGESVSGMYLSADVWYTYDKVGKLQIYVY